MNGIHDMGGMHGFGPVQAEPGEPLFHAPWERRALGLTLAMGATGQWNIDISRSARESLPPAIYLASSYYENPDLCATLRLVYTEGTCQAGSSDIYRTHIDTEDVSTILNYYQSQQVSSTAHRDVAHLFTGTRFTDGSGSITSVVSTIGLASSGLKYGSDFVNGVLCNESYMYGINAMGARTSQNDNYNPTLFGQVRPPRMMT